MKILKYIGYVFLSVVGIFLVFIFISNWPMKFDQNIWLNSNVINQKPYPRLKMADDLINHEKLIGLNKSEVIHLLGDPGDHGYFRNYDLVYWLGPERTFMSIDSEWLAIRFGQNEIFQSAEIVRD
ncbi:MAG: hypothetical protein D3919_06325 [Candidatus Electrothrix sp. AW5]|nr:hypothetical protein [Candidatus Electrothrix sp. AX1]MCI5183040.1 hypothetical protein [Candidatus Electrothrix gigas]MCI5195840.1 hypothetical protein [Candidatus Electrothrix gigas]